MKLQEILNNKEVQKELDKHMRANWFGIPDDFSPVLDLSNPYSLQNLTKINIKGVNNYSNETITSKELNYLYLYCFVKDFHFFYKYERATEEEKYLCYSFPEDLPVFRKFSHYVDIEELEIFVLAYMDELENYINITGRDFIYLILD